MKSAVLAFAVLVVSLGLAAPAAADCIVTNTAGDLATPGSLGACIVQANSNGAPDTITFNIPVVAGSVTILPAQEYVISEPDTVIDGLLKRSVAVILQYRNVVGTVVCHSQILVIITVEVDRNY